MVAVPVAVFLVCFGVALYAAWRWLPGLASGPVGDLAFYAVCGLLGAAGAVFGLGVWSIVENMAEGGRFESNYRILGIGLESLLWQTGLLLAAAIAVFLLAPPRDEEEGPLASGADPGADAL